MTEDEAKTKWCPFARVIEADRRPSGGVDHRTEQTPYNRLNLYEETPGQRRGDADARSAAAWTRGALCIGSACMAWRAGPEALAVLNIIENVQDGRSGRLMAAGYELDEHGLYWRKPLPPGGYCGLAGRPA